MKVEIFVPCFIDQLYPQTAFNMVKILEKVGCEISYNPAQTCCGQPSFNAGFWEEAKEVAAKFLNDFSGQNHIVTPSGSCAGMVKSYYQELFNHSRLSEKCNVIRKNMYEFSDFLVNKLNVADLGASMEGVAVYHDACGALRECGIKESPRKLLQNVQGLVLKEMQDCETCCGFGGTFSIKFDAISSAMAEQKVNQALEAEANYIISTDYSCLMHLEGYIDKHQLPIKTIHIADVLVQGW